MNRMDNNTSIFLIIICSFISVVLLCSCSNYYRNSQRDMQSRINIKNFYNKLTRKRLITPVISISKEDEEFKDEKENIIRSTQLTNINTEDNV